ncbi:MAG: hypothetical protein HY060_16320 [Proteobacteria bacterium]|nr:hypothetical protein [Pseudomonadota bacterium]
MTGDYERTRSRAEIDTRARTARVTLERSELTLAATSRRPFVLRHSLAELWRQLTAPSGRDEREA